MVVQESVVTWRTTVGAQTPTPDSCGGPPDPQLARQGGAYGQNNENGKDQSSHDHPPIVVGSFAAPDGQFGERDPGDYCRNGRYRLL